MTSKALSNTTDTLKYFKDYYQKHKERKKQQRRERYAQQKLQAPKKLLSASYYEAGAVKVLMSLKQYTELNQTKHQI
jgi:hypothetical protein